MNTTFLHVAEDLELAGLYWNPAIGDEVADRKARATVSILVDPQGLSPGELRATYLWLPTVEQLVLQIEARQAILRHTGLELDLQSIGYRTVIKTPVGEIEGRADSMRSSMGLALRNFLLSSGLVAIN